MARVFQHVPQAVVFDLDGTLIDSRGDIAAAVNHALVAHGKKPLGVHEIASYVGDGARPLLARAAGLGELTPEVDALVTSFLEYYVAHPADFTRWAKGVPAVLDRLAEQSIPLALCTNKARPVTDAVLAALGLDKRFSATYAGGDGPERKPSSVPLVILATKLGLDTESLVMVGDGPQDVESARRADCRAVAVISGYTSRDRLEAAQPDVVIDGLTELPNVIRRWRDITTQISPVRSG